ncbi:MAG: hypothetical protein EOO43_13460 [Flavobacterium sp.]|nr:MAG: hypothetical protein EOO43_13460 [Flavobacterium sp.]
MKKYQFLFSVISTLISTVCSAQNVHLEVANKTGYDIDSVAISHTYIGLIKRDTVINIICDRVETDSKLIMGFPDGSIKGKIRYPKVYECGVGLGSLVNGTYKVDIVIVEDPLGYQLYYRQKKNKKIDANH